MNEEKQQYLDSLSGDSPIDYMRGRNYSDEWDDFRNAFFEKLKAINRYDDYLLFVSGKPTKYGLIEEAKPTQTIIDTHRRIDAISAAELMQMDIPPLQFIIDGMLPKGGVGLLASPPKSYKSFMMLQACLMICTGNKFLNRETKQCGCLYFDLESSKRRPRDRLKVMMGTIKPPRNLYIITGEKELGCISTGFCEVLQEQLDSHKDIGLVIIDVFQRVRSTKKRNQGLYDYDYDDISQIRNIAIHYDCTILLVHHTRKGRDIADPTNNVSGSTGLFGAIDFLWMLDKEERKSNDTTLICTGRDIDSLELSVVFNRDLFRWECLGTLEETAQQKMVDSYHASPIIQSIRKIVKMNDGTWKGSATDIINVSRVVGPPIYDSATKVGKTISDFAELMQVIDGITFGYERSSNSGRNRKYIFKCP